jgi:ribonucleoside-diphosphate reductase alpha chain
MPDYIVRWMAAGFCDTDVHEQMGIMTPEVRARKAAQEALMRGDTAGPAATDASDATNGNGNGNGAAKPEAAAAAAKPAAEAITVDAPAAAPAKLVGLDLGPACAQCGGMMQRTGSCYTCSSCGNNTGCG